MNGIIFYFLVLQFVVFTGLKAPNAAWAKMKFLYELLKPIEILSTRLQAQDLSIPTFFFEWQKAKSKLEIKSCGSPLAKQLLELVSIRENEILSCPAVLAGIFLDPRMKTLLKVEQIETSKKVIRVVYDKKRSLSSADLVESDENHAEDVLTESDDEEMKALEGKLGSTDSQNTIHTTNKDDYLLRELNRYQSIPRISPNSDINKYWVNAFQEFPCIASVAFEIISVPVTEVSVERVFSHLNYIMNKHRTRLDEGLLEDILFLRLNKKFKE